MMAKKSAVSPVDKEAIGVLAAMVIEQRIQWSFEREGNACASKAVRADQVDGEALAFSFPEKPYLSSGLGPRML